MSQAPDYFRYRITFAKRDSLRFVGHLDLAKTWERVLRRAQLPLVYSQGFNPQPKMQLASALPLGISSDCELLDVWLHEEIAIDSLAGQLNDVSPPGLRVQDVDTVDAKAPAMQTQLHSAEYEIVVEGLSERELARQIEALLGQANLERERRGKTYDLRPLILGLEARSSTTFWAELALGPTGTGRPDELLEALGIPPEQAQIHRVALNLTADE